MKKEGLIFVIVLLVLSSFVCAGELKVTEEHPFLINGSWIPAKDLKVGDFLTTVDGKKAVITNVTEVITEEPFLVYNIEAGKYHDFVVDGGDGVGIVVHNSNKPWWKYGFYDDPRAGSVLNPFAKWWRFGRINQIIGNNYDSFLTNPKTIPNSILNFKSVNPPTESLWSDDMILFRGTSTKTLTPGGGIKKLLFCQSEECFLNANKEPSGATWWTTNPKTANMYALSAGKETGTSPVIIMTTLRELRNQKAAGNIQAIYPNTKGTRLFPPFPAEVGNSENIIVNIFYDRTFLPKNARYYLPNQKFK